MRIKKLYDENLYQACKRHPDLANVLTEFLMKINQLSESVNEMRDILLCHDTGLNDVATRIRAYEDLFKKIGKEPENKECPFCGGATSEETQLFGSHQICIRCINCGAYGSDADTTQEAIKAWNTRA